MPDAGIRRRHHRRGSQWADVRSLPRHGGPRGQGGRTKTGCGRSGGYGGVFPGFRNSVAAYTVSLLHPKIIADLRLFDHGLEIVERRAQNFLPNLDGRYLLAAEGHTERNIAKFSRRRCRTVPRLQPATRCQRRSHARSRPAGAAESRRAGSTSKPSANYSKPDASATGCAGCPRKICARCSTCSRNRLRITSMAGSKASW